MIKYSNGQIFETKPIKPNENKRKIPCFSYGNRGMNLENDINLSNEFYKQNEKCLITKRPTPINVVKVDYSKGPIITNAYFEKQSTTDYNGVYKGKYIDFEAKSTQKISSFPLQNISPHQIDHLKHVIKHGGIAFFIIEFAKLKEVYFLDANYVVKFYEEGERKSIPYSEVIKNGFKIKSGYAPRLDYLEIIDKIYMNS